ncbi:phage protease [Marinobacterium stanieri]|uniref:Mu-like prophage I protein n=1 Tax=Marinobacterium stanieri TaxID=49186 RepID=A0A1N6RPG2_9GAMM|nr:phage protease [Marinobacterium stanieri]SIQ30778.1 Mu-like prophage I protein [Marinobacterium stanieri]
MKTQLIAACALQVTSNTDVVRLMPGGRFEAPRGALAGSGPWSLTEERARQIMSLAAARSTDIAIDYEHQTLLADQNGKPAPAAGWVDPKTLVWRDDGLYGQVKWTAAAKQAIEADEYRYLSPVFPYDKNGEPLDILHIALTNTPAIDTAVPALAAARMAATESIEPEEDSMDKAKLLKALGLEDSATDEQIEQAIEALTASASMVEQVRKALDMKEDEAVEDKVAALKAGAQPDPSQFVPVAVLNEAQEQLAALKSGSETAELDALIKEGLADGRIPGQATADWLKKQGLAACKNHLQDAPSIAALKGATQTRGKEPEPDNQDQATDAEVAVCKNMGLSLDAYRAANSDQAQ